MDTGQRSESAFLTGLKLCFGVTVWKAAFPPLAGPCSFSTACLWGCVLCWAAGQQWCCFRPPGCFLYPLCSCHTLIQEEPDTAAQRFVAALSSRKRGDCWSVMLFHQQQSETLTHTYTHQYKTKYLVVQ